MTALENFVRSLQEKAERYEWRNDSVLTRPDLEQLGLETNNMPGFRAYIALPENKISHGKYRLSFTVNENQNQITKEHSVSAASESNNVVAVAASGMKTSIIDFDVEDSKRKLIRQKNPNFVKFGAYDSVKKIVSTRQFFPIFIYGETGTGKTEIGYQVSAELNYPLVHTYLTSSTDETTLFGSFRLINGNTVWEHGPVIQAMRMGAILFLDEIDQANANKIMCLQPILEGKGVYLKEINLFVKPEPGFNIILAANTKGKGSDTGRYISSNVLNEAMLDRIPVWFPHDYPSKSMELKILEREIEKIDVNSSDVEEYLNFANNLVEWSAAIRVTFNQGGIDDLISMRRLLQIIRYRAISNCDRLGAIQACIFRFTDEIQESFIEFYKKIDDTVVPIVPVASESDLII